ncbi:MAG TPA: hypothetical protein VNW73_09220 [Ktedonobacteraceae bacterium]|jgi:hypothetical protein|nr:hypothetical protein [Ktedonobacteraceae bacterium]
MAKKANTTTTPSNAEVNEQKDRKKQAKREAKMMLEIEEAKSSIEKAEKRLAKAQVRLEASNTHLRTLEAELSEFRALHEGTEVSAPDTGFDHQNGQPEPGKQTIVSAQNSDTDQQAQQPVLKDEEATIIPAIGSNHQTQQPDPKEITSSNQ